MKKNKESMIAKKYAQAFLGVFIDTLSLEDMRTMQAAQQFLARHKRALFFLTLPIIDRAVKRDSLISLVDKFGLPASIKKLIDLLLVHKRTFLLRDILGAIITEYQRRYGIVSCTITSSHSLSQRNVEMIKGFLAQETGCDIIYEYKVDNRLIAGIRVQSDTFLWEYSIAKQLHDMRLSLIR